MRPRHRNSLSQLIVLSSLVMAFQARVSAVELSLDGTGDVSLVPFISAHDTLDTLITVRNTGSDSVAARFTARNGSNGDPLTTAILFLGPSQQLRLIATRFPDIDSVAFLNTQACVLGSQPREYFQEIPASGRMDYAWGEIYEIGTLSAAQAEAIQADCDNALSLIGESLDPPNGTLAVDAHLIDVLHGFNLSLGTTALKGFGGPTVLEPIAMDTPTLDDALPESAINGQTLTWSSGAAAVSSVLALSSFSSVFQAEGALAGKTDLVLTFPTHHLLPTSIESPFEATSEEGQILPLTIFDRDGADASDQSTRKCSPQPPLPPRYLGPSLSASQMSLHFQAEPLLGVDIAGPAGFDLTTGDSGSCIFREFAPVWDHLDTGTVRLALDDYTATSLEGVVVRGLPVLPISITTISNGVLTDSSGSRFLSNYGLTNTITVQRSRVEP